MKTNFENLSKKFETYLKNNKDLQFFLRFLLYPFAYLIIIILFNWHFLSDINNFLLENNYNFTLYIEHIFYISLFIILLSSFASFIKYTFILSISTDEEKIIDQLTSKNIYLQNKIQKLEKILESKN